MSRFILNRSAPRRAGQIVPRYLQVAAERRQRNKDEKKCLNENKQGTHGMATHGVLCRKCRAAHRGVPIEQIDDVPQAAE